MIVLLFSLIPSGVLAWFAYPLDLVRARPAPGRFADNGLSELLAVDEHRLLALERSGVQDAAGVFSFHIRLYLVETAGATDVHDVAALQGAVYRPLAKRLLLDLNKAGQPRVDNLEGMAWGPKLANGHDTLVLVSDDNFSDTQLTQFLAFEVVPEKIMVVGSNAGREHDADPVMRRLAQRGLPAARHCPR